LRSLLEEVSEQVKKNSIENFYEKEGRRRLWSLSGGIGEDLVS
jgi:hypothetical protein